MVSMAEKINVMIKEPGENWERREIDNNLKTFQGLVGGHISTVHVREDLLLIVNDEAVLMDMEPNLYIGGYWLRGTIVAVGLDGEDFSDCPIEHPWRMRIAVGIANARK